MPPSKASFASETIDGALGEEALVEVPSTVQKRSSLLAMLEPEEYEGCMEEKRGSLNVVCVAMERMED